MKTAPINQKDEGHLVPANKLAVLHRAILEKCDRIDGVGDPACRSAESNSGRVCSIRIR